MSLPSNLPLTTNTSDSASAVRSLFDGYYTATNSFPTEQVDAVIGFFKKRGFDDISANSTSVVLLQQARIDNVNIFQLLDTLGGLTEVQMSAIVTQVLNYNRQKNSVLGYRQSDNAVTLERRNILV